MNANERKIFTGSENTLCLRHYLSGLLVVHLKSAAG